jgi:hypothetical protein
MVSATRRSSAAIAHTSQAEKKFIEMPAIEHMFGRMGGVAEQAVASTDMPLERLEAQICEGAAHLAAGMGRRLLFVGGFDRRMGRPGPWARIF